MNRETSLNLTLRPDECRSAASYVAAGLQLATRRGAPPPPGRGSPDAWHRVGDVSADAIRACVALASCPAGGGRCFELARDVAEAWAAEGYSNPTQGADVEARTTTHAGGLPPDAATRAANAAALGRWSIATSCALSLVRCQASGAIPPRRRVGRARRHLGRYQQIVRGGCLRVTRVREGEGGSREERPRPSRRVRARRSPNARPRSRRSSPSESRSFTRCAAVSQLAVRKKPADLIRFVRSRLERESSPSRCTTLSGGSNRVAPTAWQRSLDASATHPAFQGPFLTVLGLLRGVPLLSSADDVSPALAAIDALARLEFARTPDPRYATLLRDVANALASDDDVRSARLARATCESLFPDPVAELDAVCGRGVAWSDDDALGSRTHLLLRLVPYAAARLAEDSGVPTQPGVPRKARGC